MRKYALLLFLSISNGLASCQTMEQHTSEKYAWDASPTAPKGYPVQVYQGRFTDAAGKATTIPNGHYLQDGWGTSLITWIADEDTKALPAKLHLTWFSFAENKFYTGDFPLPVQRIADLFREGYYNKRKKETYDRFVVGMAPGGMLVVWLRGQNQVELARFQAKETEVDWDEFYYRSVGGNSYGKADRARDVKEEQQKLPAAVQQQVKQHTLNAGQWEQYRKKYKWILKTTAGDKFEDYSVRYWNGEQERLPTNKQLLQLATAKPLPREASVFFERDKKVRIDIVWDEQEMVQLFKNIATDDEASMIISYDEREQEAALVLRYRQQDIPFRHCSLRVYTE